MLLAVLLVLFIPGFFLTGLILLATTAVVPVARWGNAPAAPQKRILAGSAGVAAVAAAVAAVLGVREPLALAVAALAALAGASYSIAEHNVFFFNMTAGQGFIAVALVYFGAWRARGVMAGAP